MNLKDELKSAVLSLDNHPLSFEKLAMEIFRYQAKENPIYQSYLKNLRIDLSKIDRIQKIPFLPISFFKNHPVISGNVATQHIFESSGTTGQITSRHYIHDLPFYEFLSLKTFEKAYGPVTDYHILALLPGYLERSNSSLVYMVQSFIYKSYSTESGFYLKNTRELKNKLHELLMEGNRKILLIGVTFALLDLAAENKLPLTDTDKLIVMETGGMKGRRREMLREEVHSELKRTFGVKEIHSEYGMTELLSQAYSKGEGFFDMPATMRILLREVNDPFSYLPSFPLGNEDPEQRKYGKTGGINVIDLANVDSCSFIETQDLGSFSEDYSQFRILGRFDNSDVRGCNLMVG